MNIFIKPRSFFSTDVTCLQNHGDRIWEQLCDYVPEDSFRITQIVDRIPCLKPYAVRTKRNYLRLVLENVRLEGLANNYPVITKHGHTYRWVDCN